MALRQSELCDGGGDATGLRFRLHVTGHFDIRVDDRLFDRPTDGRAIISFLETGHAWAPSLAAKQRFDDDLTTRQYGRGQQHFPQLRIGTAVGYRR